MENKTSLFNNNPFTKAFQEFDEDAFFESLHNKVKNKSYFEKYAGFKITILWLSYLFNAASALTASYAVYWLTNKITGIAIIGYIVAVIFLFFLEKIKRKSSTEFWQVLFFRKEFAVGWFGLSMFCLAISLASSGFGVKEGTENLSPDAEVIASDSLANEYRNEIVNLEAENREFKKQRNHEGVIYHRTQASIKANKKMIASYQVRILELDKKLEGKNEQLSTAYAEEVELTAWTLVWLTLLMELLFEACIAYIWYYYFRSYVERNRAAKQETMEEKSLPPPTIDQSQEILNTLKTLQSEISRLKATKPFNGTHISLPPQSTKESPENTSSLPIGFYSNSQRMKQNANQTISTHGQTCPNVDREENLTSNDKYTIEHTYTKGGQTKSVRYTMRMVNSRIGQYERDLQEAKQKEMTSEIIKNRTQWLNYWKEKQQELHTKLNTFNLIS